MGGLAEFRTEVAVALGHAVRNEKWSVYPLPVESPSPPCYLLQWSEPWLEGPKTPCFHTARLDVRIIVPRLEPDAGIVTLELMIEAAAKELERVQHPARLVSTPAPYIINNVVYQSAVLALSHTVNLTGGP
jgi:hypothetical protein